MEEKKVMFDRYFDMNFSSPKYSWSRRKKAFYSQLQDWGYSKGISKNALAYKLNDEKFTHIFDNFGENKSINFAGKFWTVRNSRIRKKGSWDNVQKTITDSLQLHGIRAYAILRTLLDMKEQNKKNYIEFIENVKKISGKGLSWAVLKDLERKGLINEHRSRQYHEHWIPVEIRPLIEEVLHSQRTERLSYRFSTELAESEFEEVQKLDNELDNYLLDMVDNRIDDVMEFSKGFSVRKLAEYLKDMFGPLLYFDSLLSIIQQYSLADVEIVNPKGKIVGYTGFNLSFFGAPGTGKTFAVDDMIRGNARLGVDPHGLPGRNRYCGGMTPAKFIRIGEAYEDRKFNFIVTEFNDWFKYRGMVEPLKLAMEQREIKYEIKTETVGPYRFNSFFSVNYNTRVRGYDYEVTVSDPNFNAIEDRMLCVLQHMTKERFQAIRTSQRKLRLGSLDFELAKDIRDQLTMIYSIENQEKRLKGDFIFKPVIITGRIEEKLAKADSLILDRFEEDQLLMVSARLADRAVKLACAASLMDFFNCKDFIEISEDALELALKFYVEEMYVRSKRIFDAQDVLGKLGLGNW